jgi:rhamnogalacturonan endolyase
MKNRLILGIATILIVTLLLSSTLQAARYMENLNRGVVAVKVTSGVYVGWRMLGTDPSGIAFNVYRDGVLVNGTPITSSTNYTDAGGLTSSTYYIKPVIGGVEQAATETVSTWATFYKTVPTQTPPGGTTPDAIAYTYTANDCSVGDLDGDSQYELVVKWDPSNSKDNANSGYSGNCILDGYEFDGTRLWRIDLGINIRAGAHYTQFMVYDLDSDGKAEVVCKTAPGTKDGLGANVIMGTDNPLADYRSTAGYILTGPEYLTVFNGQTGANMATVAYDPPRGTVTDWGDNYGNRVDRFLACVAYLDGTQPSVVMCRGYYAKTVLAAWNWRNGQLSQVWKFDSTASGNSAYAGQGNHNLSVGDVDADTFDEIVYGACAIDHDGTGLYTTGLNHGDAMHLSDMDPARPGLEVWQPHETASSAGAGEFRNAGTGSLIWGLASTGDTGRGLAAHIDSLYTGYQFWSSGSGGVRNVAGTVISTTNPSINFATWWDGDLQRELVDVSDGLGKNPKLDKWNGNGVTRLLSLYNYPVAYGSNAINSTKGNPCLSADILGDWREELIYRLADGSGLIIFTTTTATTSRFYTFMHDPQYRLSVAWQNVAYNQPPHTSFYVGAGMATPPVPDIILVGASDTTPPTPNPMTWATVPNAVSTSSISMVATTATDTSGVEYYFANVTDAMHDSGWQASPIFTDTGLAASTLYTYRVIAHDLSTNRNETGWSTEASATTLAPDTTPPTPNPMTFATAPYATGTTTIAMVATTATDASGVEYLFTCTLGGGHSSAWQASTSYTDTGLTPSTSYTYTVTARDLSANQNQTTASAPASATTQASAPTTPTFVAAGTIASGTGTIAPALPSGIATGDVLLLFVETANQAVTISNQNGGTWTAVTNSPQGTGTAASTSATRLTAFWSRYNGTQGAPTVSDSGDHQVGRIVAFRGVVSSGDPWNVTAGGIEATADTSGSIPGATTTVSNTLVVVAIATALPDSSSTTRFSAWTNANLTSVTERTDNSVTAGNGGGLGIATGIKATAGAYGNTAVTLATSSTKGMMSIALKGN